MEAAPWILALPWALVPLVILLRLTRSRDLHEYAPARAEGGPRVSVIVPARNEAHNIERCVRSLLATHYRNAEFIVVDDHSTDDTGTIARRLVADEPRARVTVPPPLPPGWFGKQWACAHGAALATGDILLFTDADTTHEPELLPRSVTALNERGADLLSVLGRQEMVTAWEKLIQPAVFIGLLGWYGGTETMSRSRRPRRKIANGQYLLMRRDVYDALGGHAAVREYAAEDLMFAQTWTAAGRTVHMIGGVDFLTTRMYTSFAEIVRGWSKNAWTGGRFLFPPNRVIQAAARASLPLAPSLGVAPVVAAVLAAVGMLPPAWLAFGAWAYAFQTVALIPLFAGQRLNPALAAAYPVGAALAAYIFLLAAIRGDYTEWKGRAYRVA